MWCYFFGALWGLGGLTFGLTMRYLGMSLGMAVALGYCAAFGTLMPPIFRGEFVTKVLGTQSGQVILFGIVVCLVGIAMAGLAGISKEREMPEEQKQAAIKEFNLKKGLLVATFSGVMSACFSYGLAAGEPIGRLTLRARHLDSLAGTAGAGRRAARRLHHELHLVRDPERAQQDRPRVLQRQHARAPCTAARDETIIETAIDAPGEEMARRIAGREPRPLTRCRCCANYFFSALAGTTWYFQFFFYTMGETQMGAYGFSSWTLHMASIIIFSTLWGLVLHEWRGSSSRTIRLVWLGVTLLVLSTMVVGYGNYLGTRA